MKITKNKIKDIILQVLNENEEQTDTAGNPVLGTGSKSKSQRATDALARIKSADAELTGTEQNLIDQFEKFMADLAGTPGVDLIRHRSLLQRIMLILQKTASPDQSKTPAASNTAATSPAAKAVTEACGGPQMSIAPVQDTGCADDHEASMAKSDLYKAANYATELEQMIQDGEELDGWVQAKITKAADYLSSVKHYLEYEKIKG